MADAQPNSKPKAFPEASLEHSLEKPKPRLGKRTTIQASVNAEKR